MLAISLASEVPPTLRALPQSPLVAGLLEPWAGRFAVLGSAEGGSAMLPREAVLGSQMFRPLPPAPADPTLSQVCSRLRQWPGTNGSTRECNIYVFNDAMSMVSIQNVDIAALNTQALQS